MPDVPESAPPRRPRRARPWLALGSFVLTGLLLLLWGLHQLWQRTGLQVEGMYWQNGLHISSLRWHNSDGCEQLQAENLSLGWQRPYRIDIMQARWLDCPAAPLTELPTVTPPRLPPLQLQILQLHTPWLTTPLQLQLQRQQAQWLLQLRHEDLQVRLDWQDADGHWTLDAHGQLTDTVSITASGEGRWQAEARSGQFQLQGQQSGILWQADGVFNEADWTLQAQLTEPVVLGADWSLTLTEPLHLKGRLQTITQAQVMARISTDQQQIDLALAGDNDQVLTGWLALSGQLAQGRLPLQINREQLQVGSGRIDLAAGHHVELLGPVQLPLARQGEARLSARLHAEGFTLETGNSPLSWSLPDWRWQSDLVLSGAWQQLPVQGRLGLTAASASDGITLTLARGSRLSSPGGQWQQVLLGPLQLTAITPTQLRWPLPRPQVHGHWTWQAGPITGSTFSLPPQQGHWRWQGQAMQVQGELPDWQTRWQAKTTLSHWDRLPSRIQAELDATLTAAIGRQLQLPVTPNGGRLSVRGQVRPRAGWQTKADMALDEASASFGNFQLHQGRARLQLDWQDGRWQLRSQEPLTLARADVGLPVTEIQLSLAGDPDQWQLRDLRANLLGGQARMAHLDWPGKGTQTLHLAGIDLQRVLALQGASAQGLQLSGRLDGELPMRWQDGKLGIVDGRLKNQGPLYLRIPASATVVAMARSNPAVQYALDLLAELAVSEFDATLDMRSDGWTAVQARLAGANPRAGSQPVVFNYRHEENLLDLLRSLRISETISERVLERQR